MPTSTARRSTCSACARSRGGPHTPSPVSCMVPYPSRTTGRSPPSTKVPEGAARFWMSCWVTDAPGCVRRQVSPGPKSGRPVDVPRRHYPVGATAGLALGAACPVSCWVEVAGEGPCVVGVADGVGAGADVVAVAEPGPLEDFGECDGLSVGDDVDDGVALEPESLVELADGEGLPVAGSASSTSAAAARMRCALSAERSPARRADVVALIRACRSRRAAANLCSDTALSTRSSRVDSAGTWSAAEGCRALPHPAPSPASGTTRAATTVRLTGRAPRRPGAGPTA